MKQNKTISFLYMKIASAIRSRGKCTITCIVLSLVFSMVENANANPTDDFIPPIESIALPNGEKAFRTYDPNPGRPDNAGRAFKKIETVDGSKKVLENLKKLPDNLRREAYEKAYEAAHRAYRRALDQTIQELVLSVDARTLNEVYLEFAERAHRTARSTARYALNKTIARWSEHYVQQIERRAARAAAARLGARTGLALVSGGLLLMAEVAADVLLDCTPAGDADFHHRGPGFDDLSERHQLEILLQSAEKLKEVSQQRLQDLVDIIRDLENSIPPRPPLPPGGSAHDPVFPPVLTPEEQELELLLAERESLRSSLGYYGGGIDVHIDDLRNQLSAIPEITIDEIIAEDVAREMSLRCPDETGEEMGTHCSLIEDGLTVNEDFDGCTEFECPDGEEMAAGVCMPEDPSSVS